MTTISTEPNEPGAVSPSPDKCDQPKQFREMLTQCADTQIRILRAIDQLSRDREVLSAMHEQNRSLLEGFHERETLLPVLRSLIAIADRIRDVLDWTPQYDNLDTIVQTSLEWERKIAARDPSAYWAT
ncbi:MAG: hypothetical protein IIA08_09245 [Proteobacteria bacterium]|nr:hypothetical protein [Pseudomonadota bacterium]